MFRHVLLTSMLIALPVRADDATDALAKELRDYATAELAKVPGKDGKYSTALPDYLSKQIKDANERDREAWNKVKTQGRLGEVPRRADQGPARVARHLAGGAASSCGSRCTKTIEADDYAIDNLLYESRPGVWVTGNLYRPAKARDKMPVILIVHSHHAPKHQGELQDMGVTWAKLGCMVLVIDQLGHGERRQHPFATAKDYPKEFRVGRQDYLLPLQPQPATLPRRRQPDGLDGLGPDARPGRGAGPSPGPTRNAVILLGAVAGGGDPAAVTAALDPRITCVVPFNFGGPQPENRYPLPEDAETSFNYAGSGSWESTRNLRDSAAKGFLPWVIVASRRPAEGDPRPRVLLGPRPRPGLEALPESLGLLRRGRQPLLHARHRRDPRQRPDGEPLHQHRADSPQGHLRGVEEVVSTFRCRRRKAKERRPASELRCWTDEAVKELKPKPLHEVLAGIAVDQAQSTRRYMASINDVNKREAVVGPLAWPLGIANYPDVAIGPSSGTLPRLSGCRAERMMTSVNAPPRCLLLLPKVKLNGGKYPVVAVRLPRGAGTIPQGAGRRRRHATTGKD